MCRKVLRVRHLAILTETDGALLMRLYLAQHGEAVAKEVDPDRPLSARGRTDVERVAALLAGHVDVTRIVHSGKTRARETARLLAATLAPDRPVQQLDGLAPNDPVAPLARRIIDAAEDTLLVGHLPFMAKLLSHLVAATEDAGIVAFCPGALACLELGEDTRWRILWMVRPELLGS
jgi:phosphohistidine phosphatase